MFYPLYSFNSVSYNLTYDPRGLTINKLSSTDRSYETKVLTECGCRAAVGACLAGGTESK